MTEAPIDLRRVHAGYGAHPVLKGVDFTLRDRERIGIVGAIGSGKTTLLHLIVGLRKPTSGTVRILGRIRTCEADFRDVRTRIGLVFQDPDDQLFCPTVLDDVAFGPLNLGHDADTARAMACHALDQVGLGRMADRITYRLSGGEKRLIALATVLAMNPEVLLLDEPTASLDPDSVERLADTLHNLPQAMVVVSHERGFLARVTTQCIALSDGRVTATRLP